MRSGWTAWNCSTGTSSRIKCCRSRRASRSHRRERLGQEQRPRRDEGGAWRRAPWRDVTSKSPSLLGFRDVGWKNPSLSAN